MFDLEVIDWKKMEGLIPVVVQDIGTNEVLMLAYVSREALKLTLATNKAWFFSRSRSELWLKGQESGHVLIVHEVRIDCDADAVLYRAKQTEPGVCHEGYRTCFFREVTREGLQVVEDRLFDPKQVYKK